MNLSYQSSIEYIDGGYVHAVKLSDPALMADAAVDGKTRSRLQEFTGSTSAHGIPHIGSSKSYTGKTVWTIIFILCICIFVYEAFDVIGKFTAHEKIVNIEIMMDTSHFPAITVCNLNPYKNSLVREVDEVSTMLDVFEDAMASSKQEQEDEEHAAAAAATRPKRAAAGVVHVPVVSYCQCKKGSSDECLHFADRKPTKKTELCLCDYNLKHESPWPCYNFSSWQAMDCERCFPDGYCVKPSALKNVTNGTTCHCHVRATRCLATPIKNGTDWDIAALWHATPAPYTAEYVEAMGFENVTDEIALVTKAKENMVFTMAGMSEDIQKNVSYKKRDLIRMCSFNGQQCDIKKDFRRHQDPVFGSCYTFNHDRNKSLSTSRAGPMHGLRMLVFVNTSDYLPMSESAGVRITIHEKTDFPFPDAFGYSAPTGFMSSFGIKLKRMRRLPSPYGHCVTSGSNEPYIYPSYGYSPEGCHRSCFQMELIRRCGCGDPRFPVLPPHIKCPAEDPSARSCLDSAMTAMGGLHGDFSCDCQQPCNESIYSMTYSASKWPSGSSQIGTCNKTKEECIEIYKQHAAMVEIYYEQLSYELFRESQAYQLSNFIADLGGHIGLWLGFSIITVFECVILFWDLFTSCCRRKKPEATASERNHQPTTNAHSDMEKHGDPPGFWAV